MGCRLPGSITNPSELWDLLSNKRTGRRDFSPSRINLNGFYHPDHQKPGSINTQGGYLLDEDPRLFDHIFFGMNPPEVMTMDPMQRKLLEVAYEALESAGEPWEKFSGSRTGVFVGNFNIDHHVMQIHDIDFPLPYAPTGGSSSILSNRINYLFNLRGPSMTVDTACSSSMYALHLAVNSIRNGDCDDAIVGGSNLILSPEMQLLSVKLGALSPTSTCHTFDASADGYARGEGFTALYLKRYSDAVDGEYPIRALIRGTGVNSNGRTAGISHPSVEGQEALIRQVYKTAGLPTHLTGYFECHGTGTPVGDPVEVSAIGKVFGPQRQQEPLLIGSVKTNLGHSEPASGVTGVMKAILAIENGIIPPTVGVENLNPNIDFDAARVRVVTRTTPWPPNLPRRASVNSFGYGGANGHCIIEHRSSNGILNGHTAHLDNAIKMNWVSKRAIAVESESQPIETRRLVLLPFSAHDQTSLKQNVSAIKNFMPKCPLSDLAYTLSSRRSKFLHKSFSIVDSRCPAETLNTENVTSIKSLGTQSSRIGFVFTGQGAQWQDMGRTLFEYGVFHESIRTQDFILRSLSFPPSWTLEDILTRQSDISVQEPEISQTICTSLQVALVDLLRSWNIVPEVTVGHSSGEIAAAYAAGHLSLAEAIVTSYCRGMSIAKNPRQGLMLAVGISAGTAFTYLSGVEAEVKIAAINSPSSVTLSGDVDQITDLESRFKAKEIFARVLQTGGNAYHSHHMAAIGSDYEAFLTQAFGELDLDGKRDNSKRYPQIPWLSSVTPHEQTGHKSSTPKYWRQNLESPVRFSQAIEALVSGEDTCADILIEIGPHSALQSPLKQILVETETERGKKAPVYLSALKRFDDGMHNLLSLCGSLFCLNASVDLAAVNSVEKIENHTMRYVHGKVCPDLPAYRYNYGPLIYYENRIAREIRLRQHVRHDLIGVRQTGCAKESPSWRNVLRVGDLPWLKDHKLLPHPVMPGSGYVCMAIEAVSQFLDTGDEARKNPSFQLRNVSIRSAMRIPEDDIGLEVVLNLQASSTSATWFDFKISSYSPNNDVWTVNASSLIKMSISSNQTPKLKELDKDMDCRVIEMQDWQEKFQDTGLGYGKAFQGLSDLLSDPGKSLATAKVALNTTNGMFKGPESSYPIHPASLDLCHQLALIATHGGQTGRVKNAFIPVYIDEMTVWSRDKRQEWGRGVAVGEFKGLRGAHAKLQLLTQSGNPIIEISKVRCVAYNGGDRSRPRTRRGQLPNPYTRLVWRPDISTLNFDQAKRLFPPTVAIGEVWNIFHMMDKASVYMIMELAQRFKSFVSPVPHLRQFLAWIQRSAAKDLPHANEACSMSSEGRSAAIEEVCTTLWNATDVKHTKRIYDNISDILNGTRTGVEIAMQDNLLEELYTSSLGIRAAYPQLERLLDLLGHRNPKMKVLEIGAGTGGATRVAMRALGADTDSKRYKQYTFTDVSAAFLGPARAEFASCKGVSFKTLDINQDPLQQGFEANFDLVIASQCLHATSDVNKALQNARSLLKTGGKMILLESTRTWIGHSLAYGTFPGWWPEDSEKDSPFLSSEEWKQCLEGACFSGIDIELDDYPPPIKVVSTILTTAVEDPAWILPSPLSKGEVVYVIYQGQITTFHNNLAAELRNRGLKPLVTTLDSDEMPNNSCLILTTSLEVHSLVDGTEEDFLRVKTLTARASTLLWLTQGGILGGSDPKAAVATGLVRMLITENPLNRYGIFHLEPNSDLSSTYVANQVIQRFARLRACDFERELALHSGIPHISRLILDHDLNERYRLLHSLTPKVTEIPLHNQRPMMVDFETPGLLSSLYFKEDTSFRNPLPHDYIEVRTAAIGLNWKDIAVSAGQLDMNACSSECTGTVTAVGSSVQGLRPGDRVYGLAWGRFGTRLRFPSSHAQVMQDKDRFEEMATLPIVFCTAVYALKHLARLSKGERVLIQSATGGLGLATVQISQGIGAEIFATVGSEEKAQYLVKSCGIPRERIFSSRDPDDIQKLLPATGGKGLNVILSTSNGDVMHETWRCIAPRGRFIDVGRVDVQNHGTMAMEIFERNATFSSFDLSTMAVQDVEFCGELMQEVGDMVRNGEICPIAFKTFDVSELEKAMLYFSKGKHIGKVVATYEDQASIVKMIPPRLQAYFDPEAEYVLVGGLGGLGRSILQWMVSRGAHHFTVLSRSGGRKLSQEAATMINTLSSQDIAIKLVACDISVKESVAKAILTASKERPIKGILHAAVAFLDQPFDTLPYSQWKGGLSAKVQGTINLHEVSVEQDLPLDFFIMTSSFEAVVALPTQAAYCAANSFQDAFARYRRAQGLPASSIAFGLITEIGEVGQRDATRQMVYRNGLYRTGELGFLRLLEATFLDPPTVTSSWYDYDPLAEAQITTCLEPSELAKIAYKVGDGPPPRWHSDAKFSHLLQAMLDQLSSSQQPYQAEVVASAMTTSVDAAICSSNLQLATSITTNAIIERTAGLLMIPVESIEAGMSVAEYGVDSLIAVELRNWVALMFETSIPLLKLLDERVSMRDLGEWIVNERK
ncbi:hypothetical protein K469DRAFT_640404, partial [Zopfia rhizophila CBS 207.26]